MTNLKFRTALLWLVFALATHGVHGKQAEVLNEEVLSEICAGCLHLHVSENVLTPEIAAATLSNYVDILDYSRVFFLQSDVDAIHADKVKIPQAYASKKWSFVSNTYSLFLRRADEQLTNALKYLNNPALKLEKEREISVDRKKRGYPKTRTDALKCLEDSLQYQLAYLVSIGEPFTGAVVKVVKRRERLTKRFHDLTSERRLGLFVNAFCHALDPHSAYLSRDDVEDFQINMELSLEGIGASLGYEDGITVIKSLTPGGPAEKSGLLCPNDSIVAVGQGKKGSLVDIIDTDLRDVVKLIRGKKGTVVRLKIVRKGGKGIERNIVAITRDKVNLEDQAARMEYVDVVRTNAAGEVRKLRIALIDLPSFYVDTKTKQFFGKYKRSAVSDVRRLLDACRTAGVDGVVFDLQRNGGGALDEAVDVAGLFLAKGNVVIATDRGRNLSILSDTDSDLNYSGPLVITVSRATASGAEIVAGALQDYARALIVGGDHTFGKGTIQQVIPLSEDLGALKITMGEYFIASGRTTQRDGVESDIVLPSQLSAFEIGEQYQPNALPARAVKSSLSDGKKTGVGKDGWREVREQDIARLARLSAKRAESSKRFEDIRKAVAKIEEERARETVTIASLLDNVDTNKNATVEDNVSPLRAPLTNDVVIMEATQILADWLCGPAAAPASATTTCVQTENVCIDNCKLKIAN